MKLVFYEIWIIFTLKLIIVRDMNHLHFEFDYCMRYESFSIWNWLLYEIWIIFHLKWLFYEICIIFNLKLIIVWDMHHFPFEIDFFMRYKSFSLWNWILYEINHCHFEIDYFMRYEPFALSIVVSLYSEFRNGWHSRIKHFSS